MSSIAQPSPGGVPAIYAPDQQTFLGWLDELLNSGFSIPPGSWMLDPNSNFLNPVWMLYSQPATGQPQIIPTQPPSQGASAVMGQTVQPGPAFFVTEPEMGEPGSGSPMAQIGSNPIVWIVGLGILFLLLKGKS